MVNFIPEPELLEHLEDLIFVHDFEGRICYINRYVEKLLGYAPDDVLNSNILDYLPAVQKGEFHHYLRSIKKEKFHAGIVDVLTKKGRRRLVEFRSVVFNREGKPEGVAGIGRDYTQRERMENALTEALGRFESIIKHTPLVAVQGFDAHGCIYHWNPVSERLYGMSIQEVLEKPFHNLFLEGEGKRRFLNDLKWVFEKGLPVENREFAINTADGEKKWVYSSMFPVFEGGSCLEAMRMEMDITERKKAEERLEYLSTHDSLTGIYNRAYFEEEMSRLENPRFRPVSIIVCDVDDLKLINDTFGHGRGDSVLKAVAETIKLPFHPADVIARIGGDEFVILLPLTSRAAALAACRRVGESIAGYNRNHPELPLSVSLGVSTNTDPGLPLIETFKEADGDMYNNKINAGAKGTVIYSLLANIQKKFSIPSGYGNNMQPMAVALARKAGLNRQDVSAVAALSLAHDLGKVAGWGGEGCPGGPKAEEMPAIYRVMAIVAAYNALTSAWPYGRALSHEEALTEIKCCSGTWFDPRLAECFLKLFAEK